MKAESPSWSFVLDTFMCILCTTSYLVKDSLNDPVTRGKNHLTGQMSNVCIEKMSTRQAASVNKETGTPADCRQECEMVQSLWKTVQQFYRELEMASPHSATMALFSVHSEELKAGCTPTFVHPCSQQHDPQPPKVGIARESINH